jgi:hypothetical protein
MPATPRKPLLDNLMWAITALLSLVVVYVLSYAAVVRIAFGAHRVDPLQPMKADTGSFFPPRPIGDELPFYVPVDWLIDYTPAERPLLWWSGLWGVREDFEFSVLNRQHQRGLQAKL